MDIKFGEVTRGTGRIFTRLIGDGLADGCIIESISKVASEEVPSQVLQGERGLHILVLPVLTAGQKVTVSVRDASGAVRAEASKSFEPTLATIHSKLNTLVKNECAEAIRNYDDKHGTPGPRVLIDRIVADIDDTDIIHGRIRFVDEAEALCEAEPKISCFDFAGRMVTDSWISMGDSLRQEERYPGFLTREVSFSMRIPRALEAMVIWARDAKGATQDGFRSYEAHWMRMMRDKWFDHARPAVEDGRYDTWFREVHKAKELELASQRSYEFPIKPRFSVIVPLYKTPLGFFREMAESVLAQTYRNWELILIDASPEDKELTDAVGRLVASDSRIRAIELEGNRGITENTNVGIKAATGDFLCFFDHDDVIEPDLLFNYAKGINEHSDTDLLYCDEDKLKGDEYIMPFFKPDWSPDLLESNNYVCHLLAVRKSVVDDLELPTSKYDGAQDYNMTLRVSERARNIYHVRKVLYHWRISSTSTAGSASQKTYTMDAGKLALKEHLERIGVHATPRDAEANNTFYLDYEFDDEPLVSIVIPNKDMVPVLRRGIESIYEKTTWKNFEIIIVENNSTDSETFEYYEELEREHPNLRVIRVEMNGAFNFSKLINEGFAAASGEYLLMLNNDIEVIADDWIERLMGPCQRPEVGAVGAKLLYPDGTLQHAGVSIHKWGPAHIGQYLPGDYLGFIGLISLCKDLTAVTGACLLTKRSAFEEVGGLDEEGFAIDFNDIDFCCRLRKAGYYVVYQPKAELYHYESVSRGNHEKRAAKLLFRQEQGRMMERYPEYSEFGDPFLSPYFRPGGIYRSLE